MQGIRLNKILATSVVAPLIVVTLFSGCGQTEVSEPAKPDSELGVAAEIPEIEANIEEPEMNETQEVAFRSGMEIGEVPPAFHVVDVTGPHRGKHLCYRCLYGDRPVVGIFVRDFDDNTKTLIKKIDQEVKLHQDKKMAAFVVVLTDEPESAKSDLEKIATENEIKNVPLTVYLGTDGPVGYNVARGAEVNVMMWQGDVKANRAFQKGQLNDQGIEEVIADTELIIN
ncbi:hypothetical protein [Gimesia aquarii]|uniref:Thioredoxin domain-containing protein n=1 Tax=Gimesia aquarii TaxID=2527964 RepID=A0A517W3B0_9PLAN|nr:hypothetical protein [Gimesia aquarii]QDT99736.1 hypothetical protein V144x_52490 [Gimesia aquarii]